METRNNEMDKKLNKILERIKPIDDINKNMSAMNVKLELVINEISDLRIKVKENETEISSLKKTICAIEADKRVLKDEVKSLRQESVNFLYQTKENEVEICGFPEGQDGYLSAKIDNFTKINNIKVTSNEIISIERRKSKNNKPGVVIVKFSTKIVRDEFLFKFRKIRPTATDFGYINNPNKIYCNESLPFFTKQLLYNTRATKFKEKWKYTWTKNGKIFIKRDDNESPIRINCIEDLEILIKGVNQTK